MPKIPSENPAQSKRSTPNPHVVAACVQFISIHVSVIGTSLGRSERWTPPKGRPECCSHSSDYRIVIHVRTLAISI